MMALVMWAAFAGAILVTAMAAGEASLKSPRITEQPSDVLVRRHEPATLNCKAEGSPTPAVDWYHNGQLVPRGSSANRMVLPSGALFFLHVVARIDTGLYWCVARNEMGRTRSRNATLEIAVLREEFRVSPRLTVVAAGSTATLECGPPRGYPEPAVRWKKDGDLVNAGTGRIRIVGGGNLVLDDVRPADGGSYRCVAENVVGVRESAPAPLTVQVRPRWLHQPKDVTALAGEDIEMTCDAGGEPPPTVTWQRRGGLPRLRSVGSDRATLKISEVAQSDEGVYFCEAKNSVGSIKASATLTVLSRPKIVTAPRDTRVGLRGTARLECVVSGNPTPLVVWRIEGVQDLMISRTLTGGPSGPSRHLVSADGSLMIQQVQEEDGGYYLCSAVSSVGSAMARSFLEVQALQPPPILRYGPEDQTLPLHGAARLPCESTGNPAPVVRWYFNSATLATNNPRLVVLDSGTLQIDDLQLLDSGTYTCIAYSKNGETSRSAQLTVLENGRGEGLRRAPDPSFLPGAPSKPSVVNVTETSITLTWKPPTRHGSSPVVGYIVEVFSQDRRREGWRDAARTGPSLGLQLGGLKPDTRHIFLVRAENSHGVGPPGPTSDFIRTLGLPPEVLPQYELEEARVQLGALGLALVDAQALSSTSISLSWKVKGVGDLVEGFHIWYRRSGSPDFSLSTLRDLAAESHVLIGLEKFSHYDIFLVPFYRQVEGPPSNSRSVRTLEDVPAKPPMPLTVRREPPSTTYISWVSPPAESLNGVLKGYVVQVFANRSVLHSDVILNASSTTLVLTNLTTGSSYDIRAAAFTSMGLGPYTSPVVLNLDYPDGSGSGLLEVLLQPWFIGAVGGVFCMALTVLFAVCFLRRRRAWQKALEIHLTGPQHKPEDGSLNVLHETLWINQAWRPVSDKPDSKTDSNSGGLLDGNVGTYSSVNASDYAEVDTQSLSIFYKKDLSSVAPGPYATTSLLDGGAVYGKAYSDRSRRSENQLDSTFHHDECVRQHLLEQERVRSPSSDSGSYTTDEYGVPIRRKMKPSLRQQGSLRSNPVVNWVDLIPPPPADQPPSPYCSATTAILKSQAAGSHQCSPHGSICRSTFMSDRGNCCGKDARSLSGQASVVVPPLTVGPYLPLDSGGDSSDTEGLLRYAASPPSSTGGDCPASHHAPLTSCPSTDNSSSPRSSVVSSTDGSFYADGGNFASALAQAMLGSRGPSIKVYSPAKSLPKSSNSLQNGDCPRPQLSSLPDVHWIKSQRLSDMAVTQL